MNAPIQSPPRAPEQPPVQVTAHDVRAAAARIQGAVEHTPTLHSRTLSALAGCEVILKFENLQYTSSFKERGALNCLLSLPEAARRRGVVAMSAGNHAQAVAYHGGRLGVPVTIVMPEGTPFNKVKHTRDFGARVVLEGATLSESAVRAARIGEQEGLAFVHPYDDPHVIAGQGTVALELLAAAPDVDTLVVPVGGGGLIAGMAIAACELRPDLRIYGVETQYYPSMRNVLRGEHLPCSGQTIAEGIAVKQPGELTRAIIQRHVRDLLLVPEPQIEGAIATLAQIEKTVVEGAGAAGLAAILANPDLFRGRRVATVLSGGNIDMRLLANVLMREMAREGRLLSVLIAIEDRPGLLARISTVVGEAGGNILEVSHNRMQTDMPAKSADLGLLVEARDAAHADEIRACLAGAGFVLKSAAVVPAHA
jgi:threonine dehydratase